MTDGAQKSTRLRLQATRNGDRVDSSNVAGEVVYIARVAGEDRAWMRCRHGEDSVMVCMCHEGNAREDCQP